MSTIVDKLFGPSGRLNANLTRKFSESDIAQYKSIAGITTASLNTAIYCIKNSVSCKLCLHCSAELDVENIAIGWSDKKQFCSIACKSKYSVIDTVGEIITDYSILLDKNGIPAQAKMVKYLNATAIVALKAEINLPTEDISTLLFAALHPDFVPQYCIECNTILKIHAFPNGYREEQRFCSISCKDKNESYRENLSNVKSGISRYDSPSFVANVLVDWFTDRVASIKEDTGIEILTTFEEYLSNRSLNDIRCKCISCNYEFTSHLNDGKKPVCKICNKGSSQQYEIARYIESKGFKIVYNDRDILKPYEIDIYIPSLKIGIEYDGFYWHNNKNDIHKYSETSKLGIRLIKIFEDEYKFHKDKVMSRLDAILGTTSNKIHARKCKIVNLTHTETIDFMNKNHMQNGIPAKIKLGLEYNGDLVSVMTFSAPRFNTNYEYELIRFANKLDYIVVGGASKLFQHFIKTVTPSSVISYCDVRYGNGVMYTNLGFNYIHLSKPNYFYYKKNVRHSRIEFQKHKLVDILEKYDETLTESENVMNNGYYKIYDFGNKVFEWKRED